MPADLREQVEEAARVSGRSLNSEVVERLRKSFEADSEQLSLADRVARLEQHAGIGKAKPRRKKS